MDRHALHKLSYGIYILTTEVEGTPFGCIINTAFQITAEPARIAISCNRDNFTNQKIEVSRKFGVSALAEDCDADLIGTFGYKSGKDVDKFVDHPASAGTKLGLPLFPNQSVATFECRVEQKLDVGTHTLFIGQVVGSVITRTSINEMTYRYYHEIRKGVAPKNSPTYISDEILAVESVQESYKCSVCGYVYDENDPFEEFPDSWVCPICGAKKELFDKQNNV
jgi:flavin reductase (DIM6/NTAB) family NADH-FMN oxidoreductase RutF/rubredoxin